MCLPCIKSILKLVSDFNGKKTDGYLLKSIHIYRYI